MKYPGPRFFFISLFVFAILMKGLFLCIVNFTGLDTYILFELARRAKFLEKTTLVTSLHLAMFSAYACFNWQYDSKHKKRYFLAFLSFITLLILIHSALTLILLFTGSIVASPHGAEYMELPQTLRIILACSFVVGVIAAHYLSKGVKTLPAIKYSSAAGLVLMTLLFCLGTVEHDAPFIHQVVRGIVISSYSLVAWPIVIVAMIAAISQRAGIELDRKLPASLVIIIPFGILGTIQTASCALPSGQSGLGMIGEAGLFVNALWPIAGYLMLPKTAETRLMRYVTATYAIIILFSLPAMRFLPGLSGKIGLVEIHSGVSFVFCFAIIFLGTGMLLNDKPAGEKLIPDNT